MIRTLFRNIFHRTFKSNNIKTMAISSSIGVLIGMLPLIGLRIPVILSVSLIFGLNIISIVIGLLITIIFPVVHILSMFLYQIIGHYKIPFFTLRFLYIPHSLNFSHIEKISIISATISGLFFSILLYPIFYNLYKFYIRRHTNTLVNDKIFIFQDRSGKRFSTVKIFIIVIAIVSLTSVTMFGISISVNPFLPNLGFKSLQEIGRAHV